MNGFAPAVVQEPDTRTVNDLEVCIRHQYNGDFWTFIVTIIERGVQKRLPTVEPILKSGSGRSCRLHKRRMRPCP